VTWKSKAGSQEKNGPVEQHSWENAARIGAAIVWEGGIGK
jgi:hypothetical protein